MSATEPAIHSDQAGRGPLLFSVAVLAVFLYAAYEMNTGFSTRARLFGNLIILPALGLALAQVIRELRRTHPLRVPPEGTFTRSALTWAAGFFVSLATLGLHLTIPLFTILYLRYFAGEAWAKAVIYAAVAWIFVEGVFVRLLHIPLPGGIVAWPLIAK